MPKDRSHMTVRVLSLSDPKVGDAFVDAGGSTRQAMVYHLSLAAWRQTGRPMPVYTRATLPVVCIYRESQQSGLRGIVRSAASDD